MKSIIYLVMVLFIFAVIMVGCAKKEEPNPVRGGVPAELKPSLEPYFIDANVYPQPQSMDTTISATEEMVPCAYDGMKMKKSAMQASMEYKGKTLYFCTKAEMEKFKKDPESYLAPGKP